MKEYIDLNEKQVESERDSFTAKRYAQFYHHFSKKAIKLLDVGCNTGRGGLILKKMNPNLKIIGLDCIKNRLKKLPGEAYDSSLCCYSTKIPVTSSSFDVVLAGEFIEHLYPEDVVSTLKEFYRILKRGAILLMTTPNPNGIIMKIRREGVLGGSHLSQHRVNDLKKKLIQVGFSNVKVYGSGRVSRFLGEHIPILNLYNSYLIKAEVK